MTLGPKAGDDGAEQLAAAPFHAAVLVDRDLILELASSAACPLLEPVARGAPAREHLGRLVGEHWVERMDRARSSGESFSGRAKIGDRFWELDIVQLDARRIAFYARELRPTDLPRLVEEAGEALHALKNPIYGISVASDVLVGQATESATVEVLQSVKRAAGDAERSLKLLGELLDRMAIAADRRRPP
jgi:hypothetical protein